MLNAKLRWSNEPIEIIPKSVHGDLKLEDLSATVRIRDAIHARVREEYTRVVYPYFAEEPALFEESGRLGLWAMQQALTKFDPNDMRIIDPHRRVFFSPQITSLQGDEGAIFHDRYRTLISEWERLTLEED